MSTPKCEMGCPILLPMGEEYDANKVYERVHYTGCKEINNGSI